MRVPPRHTLTQSDDACRDLFRRDHALSIPNPFPKVNQMRRSEQPRVDARRLQNRMHEGAGGPLAIRPGHVDELLARRWQIKFAQQTLHVLQPQLDAEELGAVKPVDFYLRRVVDHS